MHDCPIEGWAASGHMARSLLVCLCLAGCAGGGVAGAGCSVPPITTLALHIDRGFILAPAVIEGRSVEVVVDTGAAVTSISTGAMLALHLAPDTHRRLTVRGAGRESKADHAAVERFIVGGLKLVSPAFPIVAIPFASSVALNPAAILGSDWMSQFDVDFDLPGGTARFYPPGRCAAPPWAGPSTAAPLRVVDGLPHIAVKVDDTPIDALLDSGATSSTLAAAMAVRLGMTPAEFLEPPAGRPLSTDGRLRNSWVHQFRRLEIAETEFANPRLLVSELNVARTSLLSGVDWLRKHRIWLSYGARQLKVLDGPPRPKTAAIDALHP